jgi:hypothetical protein
VVTDYSALVKRLRIWEQFDQDLKDAADALEAQAKEIAALKASSQRDIDCIKRASIRLSELERALKMAADDLEAAAKFTNFRVYHVAAEQARSALKEETR